MACILVMYVVLLELYTKSINTNKEPPKSMSYVQ
jgi:hypothetical protein